MIKVNYNNRAKYITLECKNNCPIKYWIKNYYVNKFTMNKKIINIYCICTGKLKTTNFNSCLITVENIKTKDLIITENERIFITKILQEGYLEYPKRITISQLAKKLKKSKTGTMLALRRIFRKVLSTVI